MNFFLENLDYDVSIYLNNKINMINLTEYLYDGIESV